MAVPTRLSAKGGGRWGAALVLILSLAAGAGFETAPFSLAQRALFDFYQRLKPRAIQRIPAVIIDIDDRSLEELGQWPWPRTLTARLVEATARLGPLAIAFDIIMPEADRLSPANLAALHPDIDPDLTQQLADLPSNDMVLGEALRRHSVVLVGPACTIWNRRATHRWLSRR